jgi:predicted transposase/invertase (TIGR01784 family)
MELVQYSLFNTPNNGLLDSEKQDWITFLKRTHRMNEEEVATSIKTPEVLLAFQKAKLGNLPREVRKQYVAQDLEFDRYSDHTNKLVSEGVRKGFSEGVRKGIRKGEHKKASEIARKMLVRGRPLEEIAEYSGLTKEEVEAMKTSASHENLCKPKKKSNDDLCKP